MKEEKLFFFSDRTFLQSEKQTFVRTIQDFFKYNGGARELQTYPKTLPRL